MTTRVTKPEGLRIRSYASSVELHERLAIYIEMAANQAITDRGGFSIVITGGQTVLPLYRRLRRIETNWQSWRIYWTDERCVPPDALERNSWVAFEVWLRRVPIPAENILAIPAELGPDGGAKKYSELLSSEGTFDMVLLSVGEDGHVASIFPSMLSKQRLGRSVVPVLDAPKPPPQRVSLSLERLADCREGILMALGSGKSSVLAELYCRSTQPASLLAKMANMEIWTDIVDGN